MGLSGAQPANRIFQHYSEHSKAHYAGELSFSHAADHFVVAGHGLSATCFIADASGSAGTYAMETDGNSTAYRAPATRKIGSTTGVEQGKTTSRAGYDF